jgi:hypothetical protein
VIILVAAALAGLLAFGAISVDAGLLYAERTRLNNVADAAALAGAVALAEYPNSADTVGATAAANQAIDNVTGANGLAAAQVTATIGGKDVTVKVSNTTELAFAKVISIPTAQVGASATAEYGTPSVLDGEGIGNVVPLGIELTGEEKPGDRIVLKDGGGAGTNGDFQFLALDGGKGVPSIEAIFSTGYQGTLTLGQEIDLAQGVKNNIAVTVMPPRLNTIVFVPVVSAPDKNVVTIVGFAAFLLKEMPGNGNDNTIVGELVPIVIPGGGGAGGVSDPSTGYGLRCVRLTR